jgi:hypothetical protein
MNDRSVTVCMQAGDLRVLPMAKMIATTMFRGIGVKIDWRVGIYACPSDGIVISLSDRTPDTFVREALAYAKPYEGTHIVVFYERIVERFKPGRVPRVLGHVLVHEITHILEGVPRHSKSGVMKAFWTEIDYAQMACTPMNFDRDDVELIHAGLGARARRLELQQRDEKLPVANPLH